MEIFIKVTQLLLSLSLLVVIHEFGHFIFAKIFKCRVEKFYLFFDYKFSLFKKKVGETEFGVGWIPFGGYVKISGMVDESMDKEQLAAPPQPWEYRSKPAWQRLLIIVGGVLMNILLAMAIYIGLTFAYGDKYIDSASAKPGFAYNQTAQAMGFRNGDKVLSIDGQKVTNIAKVPEAILIGTHRNVVVDRGGEQVTITVSDSMIKGMLEDKVPFIDLRTPMVVSEVTEGSPAESAYLQKGDSLISIDSIPMTYTDEFRSTFATAVKTSPRDSLLLGYVRGADTLQTAILPNPDGTIGIRTSVDISELYPLSERKYSFLEAIPVGISRGGDKITGYFKQLKVIFTPETGAYKEVGGFITMGKIFPSEWSWFAFWNITALLSIMLAVLNILPIPALDGGHMVFIIYEMITRRAPSQKFMEGAQYVGFVLVLALLIFANGNDIIKLFS